MFRSIAIVGLLSVASVAPRQTPVDPQVSADALRQVRAYESFLRTAIGQAGSQVGDRVRKVVQDANLQFEADPYAQGLVLPTGEGILFIVEVPAIEGTSVMVAEALMKQLQIQQQNPNLPRVSGAGPPVSIVPVGVPLMDPRKEYADLSRQALVDAMLDHAFTLPLKEGQSLTLSVGNFLPAPTNPLAPNERRLWLTIKADDLIALRKNDITRDEAKARITEKRY